MGYSRDSFYRFKSLYDNGGEQDLQDLSKKQPNFKNRVPQHVEESVINYAIENPDYGQLRDSNELMNRGILISSSGVRSIWMRHDLETLKKRLKAFEKYIGNIDELSDNSTYLAETV